MINLHKNINIVNLRHKRGKSYATECFQHFQQAGVENYLYLF